MIIPEDSVVPEEPATMNPDLYQRVALRLDVAEYRLKKGDVAVLLDRVPHPSGGEPGVVLEVYNAVLSSHGSNRPDVVPTLLAGRGSP
jgi:hypothetical protein